MTQVTNNHNDLTLTAIKVARRLQALPDRRVYNVRLVKLGERWVIAVEDKGKAEVCG